jgi:hypothetical protein
MFFPPSSAAKVSSRAGSAVEDRTFRFNAWASAAKGGSKRVAEDREAKAQNGL